MELRPLESLEEINVDTLELFEIKSLILHYENLVTNNKDMENINKLRFYCMHYLDKKYDIKNNKITVRFELQDNQFDNYQLSMYMAPSCVVPYSVYFFLNIIENWKGGVIHRNAGHVKQFKVFEQNQHLAFQEYNPIYPHEKYTCGFAGRPGGPAFYINTRNNVVNHGIGSQGSKTEADSCFGKIDFSEPDTVRLLDRINKMEKNNNSGFVARDQEIRVVNVSIL